MKGRKGEREGDGEGGAGDGGGGGAGCGHSPGRRARRSHGQWREPQVPAPGARSRRRPGDAAPRGEQVALSLRWTPRLRAVAGAPERAVGPGGGPWLSRAFLRFLAATTSRPGPARPELRAGPCRAPSRARRLLGVLPGGLRRRRSARGGGREEMQNYHLCQFFPKSYFSI